MTLSKSHSRLSSSEHGSALILILVAVALFAALSFAVSRQGDSGQELSSEKARLLAIDVMDMGNKMADTVAQMRLHKITLEKISFENDIVTGYANPNCTVDTCKVFSFNGGGKDWEIPANDVNKSFNWGYTSSLSIQDVGTDAADLIAILPNISLPVCNRINRLLKRYDADGIPSAFNGVIAMQYVGTTPTTPVNLTSPLVDGQSSGCINLLTSSGTAFAGTMTQPYAYYHVLIAR